MENKEFLRAKMRALRRAQGDAERADVSRRISSRLIAANLKGVVAVYIASPSEIDLSDYIRHACAAHVRLAAPRWNGAAYDLAELTSLDASALRRGPMGILEPAEARLIAPEEVATWLVPGLAFTTDGRRLGYGGGWYDRLLAHASGNAQRLGIAASFQVVADLPEEPHDRRLTELVTERDTP